ncbi:MAG: hypothetical protein DI616_05700 [Paracoccus denitrificans]|uniref:Uncharacterized protein n=1 Tax=Paracoccus denitrificans TaxID=266 RepID=A0A533IBA7_PARDE|nr:MAG: hypothetical protein DI616_05700 [Paracoccus denitrificans]
MFFFSAIGTMIASTLISGLAVLLLTAHIGWLITLWEERLSKPVPTLASRAWILIATFTPLLSFYCVRLIDRLQSNAAPQAQSEWWRWLLPVLSVSLVLLAALSFPGGTAAGVAYLGTFFLIGAATAHMTAALFALTRRGFLTSRSQLVAAFTLVMFMAPFASRVPFP